MLQLVHQKKFRHFSCSSLQTEDSEIDVDEEDDEAKDEEEDEEEESKDLEDDSLEGPVSRGTRPVRGGMRSPLLEESDNDF